MAIKEDLFATDRPDIGGTAPFLVGLASDPKNPLDEPRRAHLVGAAGAGMTALARVLLDRGWELSGSDLAWGPAQALATDGVWHEGHDAAYVPPDADFVIRSDAIPADNPELLRAAELGIPTWSYFEMLGRLSAGARCLAVAGTHGKSTTTAMTAAILTAAGLDPTVFCGAAPPGATSGGRAGRRDLVLVEACEYRAHFLHLRPEMAVILAVEPDHFDYFCRPGQLEQAFAQFARLMPPQGLILRQYESPAAQAATERASCRVKTLGLDARADWSARCLTAHQGRYMFEVFHGHRRQVSVSLQIPGRHNVINALAAAALASHCGVPAEQIGLALGRFAGLRRRMQHLGTWRGVELLDDYAHHPTEVAAALAAVRGMYPRQRVCCVFQPHQASRTQCLLDALAESLDNSDEVWVAEIFRAREPAPRPGEVTAADLAQRVRARGGHVADVHDMEAIVRRLQAELAPGDVLITLGAGDIGKVHEQLPR